MKVLFGRWCDYILCLVLVLPSNSKIFHYFIMIFAVKARESKCFQNNQVEAHSSKNTGQMEQSSFHWAAQFIVSGTLEIFLLCIQVTMKWSSDTENCVMSVLKDYGDSLCVMSLAGRTFYEGAKDNPFYESYFSLPTNLSLTLWYSLHLLRSLLSSKKNKTYGWFYTALRSGNNRLYSSVPSCQIGS